VARSAITPVTRRRSALDARRTAPDNHKPDQGKAPTRRPRPASPAAPGKRRRRRSPVQPCMVGMVGLPACEPRRSGRDAGPVSAQEDGPGEPLQPGESPAVNMLTRSKAR
jgi:hypothetical protein